ncbi:NAD(P)H-hydrate epimerase [Nocardioides limicola]|uniref:NAD(P)H-hydrate epimerase n=1 Tax=Nocardioides limicola TaxID=2803368 RepID=UPI00193AF135|nr:NAD(P)H-hydrate epimerase [Nocardioides sp. DJM-14]
MRHAHTVDQVRDAEAALMATLPPGSLMQRAAFGLASAVIDLLGGSYGRRVLLLVGPGDNGGDALYAGALLARRGAVVEAWPMAEQCHPGGLAALRAAGGRPVDDCAHPPDVVVDGIVGIGGRPGLRPAAADAWLRATAHGAPVVAVDVPSGVDVDSGRLEGPHVVADLTVTFGTHKVAHLVDPAAAACGAVHLVDLGLEMPPAGIESLQPGDVAALLPRPRPDAHKYARGVVGVRAGSPTYPGAAVLCVAGAGAGLAGMVRYDGPVADAVRAAHPEVIAGPGQVQAWVVGSGAADHAAQLLAESLADQVPVVVDADALDHLPDRFPSPAVLTPHAGELARMLGVPRRLVEAEQLAHARAAAERFGAVVLLKGRHSLTAEPGGRVRVTTTGTPWLATAGAGDVLAGLIGALMASGLEPFEAASVGSWLHGAAATLASAGGPLTAGPVAEAVGAVVRHLPTAG